MCSACEALFFAFRRACNYGLEAYWNHSLNSIKVEAVKRDSTPCAKTAVMVGKALEEAKPSWIQYNNVELKECQITAERAVECLVESCDFHVNSLSGSMLTMVPVGGVEGTPRHNYELLPGLITETAEK